MKTVLASDGCTAKLWIVATVTCAGSGMVSHEAVSHDAEMFVGRFVCEVDADPVVDERVSVTAE
jgi:hypothetical protein